MLAPGWIKPSTSIQKISTSCWITCGTLPKILRNSQQRSRLVPTRSFVQVIPPNTIQEENSETQEYFCGSNSMSWDPEWLRRCQAKQVLSANDSQRQAVGSGSGPVPRHFGAGPNHYVAPVSRRSYCLYL